MKCVYRDTAGCIILYTGTVGAGKSNEPKERVKRKKLGNLKATSLPQQLFSCMPFFLLQRLSGVVSDYSQTHQSMKTNFSALFAAEEAAYDTGRSFHIGIARHKGDATVLRPNH